MKTFTQKLITALDAADIPYRKEYSGRAMYGATCIGVVCNGRDEVSESDVLEAVKNVRGGLAPRRDSMGRGLVLYWPTAKTEREPEPTTFNDGTHAHANSCIRRVSPMAECTCFVAELPLEAAP